MRTKRRNQPFTRCLGSAATGHVVRRICRPEPGAARSALAPRFDAEHPGRRATGP